MSLSEVRTSKRFSGFSGPAAIIVLGLGLISMLFSGCARRQIMDLQDQMNQLQDFEKEFKKENFELSSTLNRNLGRLREQLENVSKTVADLNAKLDALTDDNRAVRGKMEEMMHRQAQQKASNPTETSSESPPLEQLEPFDSNPPNDLAEKLYSNAYNDFIKGNYDLAVVGFQDFIKQYSKSSMADNALYWVGECYYTQGKYDLAMQAFDRVIKEYPTGDKVPPAMLKKGFALLESGKANDGKAILNNLIQTYPRSEEASLAQERLQHLK